MSLSQIFHRHYFLVFYPSTFLHPHLTFLRFQTLTHPNTNSSFPFINPLPSFPHPFTRLNPSFVVQLTPSTIPHSPAVDQGHTVLPLHGVIEDAPASPEFEHVLLGTLGFRLNCCFHCSMYNSSLYPFIRIDIHIFFLSTLRY